MTMMGCRLAATLIAVAAALPAQGQQSNYRVQEMNFDLWCQEQAGLPAERCDKRTDADEAAFEAYRSKVEAYEIPYLQQKDNAARLDRNILRADPVDNPLKNDPAAQQQQPSSSSTPPR
jgi:hypothetical protein